jgi:hypothetical protein
VSEAAEERALWAQLKQPLEVEIRGGELVISIGLETLALAVQAGPKWPWEQFRVKDVEQFGQDLLRELENEEEDGTTLVHRMLDSAGFRAMEQGSEGVEEGEVQFPTTLGPSPV